MGAILGILKAIGELSGLLKLWRALKGERAKAKVKEYERAQEIEDKMEEAKDHAKEKVDPYKPVPPGGDMFDRR